MNRLINVILVCLLQVSLAVASTYNLRVKVTPNGAGSVNPSGGAYEEGSSITLSTYNNNGYVFKGWYEGENLLSSATSCKYMMPSRDVIVQARYEFDPAVPANPDSTVVRYTVTVACKPADSGSFNTTNVKVAENGNINLQAYTNSGYKFLRWENEAGEIIATSQSFSYAIPNGNSKVYGIFEFDPAVPSNPNKNYWNKELGEVIVDDFTEGGLGGAVSSAISGSDRGDVAMITVAGRMNNNDFGVANNYTNCTLLDLSRVTGITQVPSYAFDKTNLESVYLPATIELIGERAFAECKQLSSLIIYAMMPPTLGKNVFANIPEGLVVYVPAASIPQYQDADGWKDFTILPIQEDIRSITISLPIGANVQDFAQMWLELTNTKNGQRIHYIMTDHTQYTFANIIRNTSWNVVLRNERGDVFGQIDNVEVKDEDVSVSFVKLSKPQNVAISVLTPDGKDVTNQVQVTWMDASGNYMAQGASLSGLPVGYHANYRMTLTQELAMTYEIPAPAVYSIKDGGNTITQQLSPITQITLSGKVKDATTGLPLSGAVVSASQTFGGKYSKTQNTKTDSKGEYTFTIAAVPTSLAVAASDYISQTVDLPNNGLDGLNELDDVLLKPVTGAAITVDYTYTTVEGETEEWYSDYQNVGFELFNVTKNRAITQYNVQYPQIVLLEDVEDGDVLRLTATSRTNAFMPVDATATISEQNATATFDIKELGKVQASFTKTGNESVVGSLYDGAGKLVKTYNYSNASLTINDLADGNYTLVSMGSSRLFNTIYDLAQLPQTGLAEGTDYVQNTVEVNSGAISTISIAEVPTLDESKLYYTGDNTSLTVNKPTIVAGNYLTLTGRIDFKPAYATNVSNVQMIVDLPESCQFVENSVMVGNSTGSYTLNGNRIIIPMARYTDRVRFCIIPTLGGDYAPSSFAQFNLNGDSVTQPIGSANYTVKDLSIQVPSVVAKTTVPISGTAIGASLIDIYDNDVLIGQTTSHANGNWQATCELNEPYNLSKHQLYARVTTKAGLELQSETVECQYDMNAIKVKTVTMINTAHPATSLNTCEYVTVFDFQKPNTQSAEYWYWPNYPNFTFLIDFTNNDTIKVKDVSLQVKLSENSWLSLDAYYDKHKQLWVSTGVFGSGKTPKNVAVAYNAQTVVYADREEMNRRIDEYNDRKKEVLYLVDSLSTMYSEMVADSIDAANKNMQVEQLISDIDTILSQDIYDSEMFCLKYAQLLSVLYFPCTVDMLQSDDDIETDEELAALYESIVLQLNDYSLYEDSIDIHNYISETKLMLGEEALTQDEYQINDTITIKNNGITQIIYPLNYNSIDISKYQSKSVSYINMTKGKHNVIIYEAPGYIILDQEKRMAWKLEVEENGEVLPRASMLKSRMFSSADSDNFDDSQLQEIWYSIIESGFSSLTSSGSDAMEKLVKNLTDERNDYERIIAREYRLRDQMGQRMYENGRKLDNFFRNASKTEERRKRFIRKHLQDLKEYVEHHNKVANDYTERIAQLNVLKAKLGMYALKGASVLMFLKSINDIRKEYVRLGKQLGESVGALVVLRKFVNTLKDCEDQNKANALAEDVKMAWTEYYLRFLRDAMFSSATILWDSEMLMNPTQGMWKKALAKDVGKAAITPTLQSILQYNSTTSMDRALADFWNDYQNFIYRRAHEAKCYPYGNVAQIIEQSNNIDASVVMDPSGYVYEGVSSNRLEGVTATAYYKEMVEDMYGDLYENIVKWDAEEYAQENPLFTDENGMYAWDVPQGLWQVKFEKDGYETTYSEWLPVPPPQLDVNIAMKQNRQPEVKAARAFEDAVEVEFDKYMMPELLTTDNIMVIAPSDSPEGGEKAVEGTIELLNEEVAYDGCSESFASKVRFNAAQPFTEQEITLMVSNRVKSYAGIRMQDNYMQTFAVEQEIKQILSDSLKVVRYGEKSTLAVSVLPASASKGKTLTVKTSSPMILGVETEQVTIGNDGKAEITISGELPGVAALTFSVEGTDKTAITIANVEQMVYKSVATPIANIASGAVVEKGTQIILSCATEGAIIYYTTDGSCPCDESGNRKVYDGTPIVINETVIIKAMAVAPNMYESETVELTYIVDGADHIAELSTDGLCVLLSPTPIGEWMYISGNFREARQVEVYDMRGVKRLNVADVVPGKGVYMGSLRAGLYYVTVTTDRGVFRTKVLKR